MKRRMVFVMLVAATASGLMAGTAFAADYGQPYTKAAAPPVYDWSGFYAGIYLPGARMGYNKQIGTLVFGGEAYAEYWKNSLDIGNGGKLKQTWSSGIRARAGVAIDRTLVYGLAGYNFAKFEAEGTVTSNDKWKGGYNIGAGVEYAMLKNVSLGLEYNYSRFNNVQSVIGGVTQKNSFGDHTVRAGVNFRF